MAMEDKFLMMSDAQAVTQTADSTNVLDLGDDGDSMAKQLWWILRANTPFDTSVNTLAASLQTASASSFVQLGGCALAATATSGILTAGAILAKIPLPRGLKRYLKTVFTCSTTLVAGKVDSFLTTEPDNY